MILLDTNVISEQLHTKPDQKVIDWFDEQPIETLFLSAITVAELRSGVGLLPNGKRKTLLYEQIEKKLLPIFLCRVLAFDVTCTERYAEILVKARKEEISIHSFDACIAAIALTHNLVMLLGI